MITAIFILIMALVLFLLACGIREAWLTHRMRWLERRMRK